MWKFSLFGLVTAVSLVLTQAIARAQSSDPCQAARSVDTSVACLFNIFLRSKGSAENPNIGWTLSQGGDAEQAAPISSTGPLVTVNGSGVFVYDGSPDTAGKTLDYVLTRSDAESGFVQMTAFSHVGPAAAYLAALGDWTDPENPKITTQTLFQALIDRVAVARDALAADPDWIDAPDAVSGRDHKDDIIRMMDYGLWMSEGFLTRAQSGAFNGYTSQTVADVFYDGKDSAYAIPFNNVMIGTFMLAAMNSVDQFRKMVADNPQIDWKNARVLVHMPIGTNSAAA
ncbi:DUF5624 domain-containing protein [uncultured Tateyamaria sp.]|uniref:DUF5624 domain-containing protein n=1 Tax=uncultured Tateyamaria sp. TaxID=455651 RepID=UPI00262639CE|nr:DUF5624 domain-containing protein [uncultured Tateyamaria sp.]